MSLYSHANKTRFFCHMLFFFFHLAWLWKWGFWNSEMANWILLHRVNSDLTQQGGRGTKTLCAKRDSNFVWNYASPNITLNGSFGKDQKTLLLSEDHDKSRKK